MSTANSNRLYAIQTIAGLVVAGIPEDKLEPVAEHFATCLFTLGVTRDEIRDAMDFALITGGSE